MFRSKCFHRNCFYYTRISDAHVIKYFSRDENKTRERINSARAKFAIKYGTYSKGKEKPKETEQFINCRPRWTSKLSNYCTA